MLRRASSMRHLRGLVPTGRRTVKLPYDTIRYTAGDNNTTIPTSEATLDFVRSSDGVMHLTVGYPWRHVTTTTTARLRRSMHRAPERRHQTEQNR